MMYVLLSWLLEAFYRSALLQMNDGEVAYSMMAWLHQGDRD